MSGVENRTAIFLVWLWVSGSRLTEITGKTNFRFAFLFCQRLSGEEERGGTGRGCGKCGKERGRARGAWSDSARLGRRLRQGEGCGMKPGRVIGRDGLIAHYRTEGNRSHARDKFAKGLSTGWGVFRGLCRGVIIL